LRVELELQLAREILLLEQFILADIGRDHLADLPRLKQLPQAEIVGPRVVGDNGEVLHARRPDLRDQALGIADEAEAARHDRHPVPEQPLERRFG
jgi:hypothetical protein